MTSPTSRTPGNDSQTADSPRFTKPVEVEELIDLHVHRPIAQQVVYLLAKTPITPNQVTVLAGLLGTISGIVLGCSANDPILRLYAAALLFVSVILDCADGQLARYKNISSTTGAILDGVADYFVGFSVFMGMMYASAIIEGTNWMWAIGWAAGLSTLAQSAIFDQVKLRYIQNANIAFQEREEDLDRVAYDRMRARQQGDYKTLLLLWIYDKYTRAQRAVVVERSNQDPETFRRENRFKMRLWAFVGPGTHLLCQYTAMLLSFFWPSALLGCFLVFGIAMNAIFFPLFLLDRMRKP
jgi:phosphatidylglycerophosphate synthase